MSPTFADGSQSILHSPIEQVQENMGDYEFHMSTIREWVFDSFKTVREAQSSTAIVIDTLRPNCSFLTLDFAQVTFKYLAHHLSVSSNYAKQYVRPLPHIELLIRPGFLRRTHFCLHRAPILTFSMVVV